MGILSTFKALGGAITAIGKGFIWLFTSPIGLTILAVVALIAVVYLVIKYWDELGLFFKRLWSNIKIVFFTTIAAIIQKMMDIPLFGKLADWLGGQKLVDNLNQMAEDTAEAFKLTEAEYNEKKAREELEKTQKDSNKKMEVETQTFYDSETLQAMNGWEGINSEWEKGLQERNQMYFDYNKELESTTTNISGGQTWGSMKGAAGELAAWEAAGKPSSFIPVAGAYDDMIWRPGQAPIAVSPDDTVVAYKNAGRGAGGGGVMINQTINVTASNKDEISRLINESNKRLVDDVKRMVGA
jgi:hypothetical protein